MFRATLVYTFIGIYLLIFAPIGMAWTLVSQDASLIYKLTRTCIRTAGWLCGIRVNIQGREKIKPGQTYVFLSNHQGNLDGPVLFHAIPRDFRALIKKEMMKIPVLSLLLKQVRFVPIDRSEPAQAKASIDRGARLLKEGYSFVAFPEGTRSRDGRLGNFKKGAFIMAVKAGVPIVPVSIVNSRALQPPGAYGIRPGTIDVIFYDPISTDHQSRAELMKRTRAAIASGLPEESEGHIRLGQRN